MGRIPSKIPSEKSGQGEPFGVRKWNSWGLVVSSIYHWYVSDFGGTDSGVISHLKKYASPGLAARLEKVTQIHNNEYDWELNNAVDGSAQADAN